MWYAFVPTLIVIVMACIFFALSSQPKPSPTKATKHASTYPAPLSNVESFRGVIPSENGPPSFIDVLKGRETNRTVPVSTPQPDNTLPPPSQPMDYSLFPNGSLTMSDCEKRCILRRQHALKDGRWLESEKKVDACILMCQMASVV